jgi:hypothetical protein
MFCASDSVVSIIVVCDICPYSWVDDMVRALCMLVAFSRDNTLELATR